MFMYFRSHFDGIYFDNAIIHLFYLKHAVNRYKREGSLCLSFLKGENYDTELPPLWCMDANPCFGAQGK